ncbi:MAG TPA: methyltransferase domain-containing protein [Thermoanaerobaculia bacterium]|jgi:glycosyltransferase involved in cell wall biosynthesis|nr:methyltransferase domain-containing protein [Thermoanaerobaculia bacterium]
MSDDPRTLGISAFLRCRNEEEYIVASILSAYRVFDEIVVILNRSTDRTRELVEDLMTDHPKIRIAEYDFDVAPAGGGYLELVEKNPERSLARYYNWCLEQTTFSHVCKWDGDMIALPLLEGVRPMIAANDVIAFDGWDVLDQPTVSSESRIFRYDPRHTRYTDWDLYEVLMHDYPRVAVYEPKCYLHMKLVKRDWVHKEWSSPNDLATRPYPAPRAIRKEPRVIDTVKHRVRVGARHARAFARERLLRKPGRYGIRGDYLHRSAGSHFDDTSSTDEYQREVYERAAELAARDGLRTVYDVGCGSGYKLVHYLGAYDTTGFEVPRTLEYLRRQYPDRKWQQVSFSDRNVPAADLVICSDVIEHVPDPDELMRFLVSVTGRWLVLSTPDRALSYSRFSQYQLGPPASEHHVREWTFDEFHRYVSQFVEITEHIHSHPEQSTQLVVARVRRT